MNIGLAKFYERHLKEYPHEVDKAFALNIADRICEGLRQSLSSFTDVQYVEKWDKSFHRKTYRSNCVDFTNVNIQTFDALETISAIADTCVLELTKDVWYGCFKNFKFPKHIKRVNELKFEQYSCVWVSPEICSIMELEQNFFIDQRGTELLWSPLYSAGHIERCTILVDPFASRNTILAFKGRPLSLKLYNVFNKTKTPINAEHDFCENPRYYSIYNFETTKPQDVELFLLKDERYFPR